MSWTSLLRVFRFNALLESNETIIFKKMTLKSKATASGSETQTIGSEISLMSPMFMMVSKPTLKFLINRSHLTSELS